MKRLFSLLLFLLSGCAFHQAPHLAYSDSSIPLSQTAVLVAWSWDRADGDKIAGVEETDGRSMNCFNACPMWVRVPAGRHKFKIGHMQNFRRMGDGTVYDRNDINITLDDMQPRHTYLIKYDQVLGIMSATVEDLGEDAGYGMRICGMYGDCKTRYRARFD